MAANGDGPASLQSDESGFRNFENGSKDSVLAIAYNPSGKRCIIAAADHKLRFYNCEDQALGVQPKLLDQWRAHAAEILDVQWLPFPFIQYIATIGADHKIKIWREDPSQAPLSGRRFRCVMTQVPAHHVPYTSFSFYSNSAHDLFLALFSHDGLLTLLEPCETDSLSAWRQIDQLFPFGRFKPGTEPQFCVSFRPGPTAPHRPSLTLALSASFLFKLYFAIPLPPTPYSTTLRESNLQLQEALALPINHILHTSTVPIPWINSLAWRPGLLALHDTLAFACIDGTIRIVEVTPPEPTPGSKEAEQAPKRRHKKALNSRSPSSSSDEDSNTSTLDLAPKGYQPQPQSQRRDSVTSSAPSRISALGSSLNNPDPPSSRPQAPLHLRPSACETESLTHDDLGKECWKAVWTYDGRVLISSGNNAEVVLWKEGFRDTGVWDEKQTIGGVRGFVEWSRTRKEEW